MLDAVCINQHRQPPPLAATITDSPSPRTHLCLPLQDRVVTPPEEVPGGGPGHLHVAGQGRCHSTGLPRTHGTHT
jgi:hypothetical protein